MERLSTAISGLSMAQKRSFVEALLEEAVKCSPTKKNTRIELARAKNRKETVYQNMVKTKERVRVMIEKLRELEASYEAANADVQRLKGLLQEDNWTLQQFRLFVDSLGLSP